MSDSVQHPTHYTSGDIECIDAIRAALGDGFEPYCIGNVIKYVWRYQMKNGAEDLEKAAVYLGWAIEAEDGKRLSQCKGCEALQHSGFCEIHEREAVNVNDCEGRRDG